MTISATTNRQEYSGDGTTTAFTFNGEFLADADLTVILVDSSGTATTQTLTTDYTVSGAGGAAGGTVTMNTAPASGETLIVLADPALTQGLDLVDNDSLPADEVEEKLDLLTIMVQRIRNMLGRAAVLDDGDISGADTTLPAPAATSYLRWNAAADALEAVDLDPDGVFDAGIEVAGDADLNGNLDVAGTTNLAGNATMGGTVAVTGGVTLASTLDVTGNATMGGTVAVTGDVSLASDLDVTGNATVGGTVAVTGDTTLSGDLTVDTDTLVVDSTNHYTYSDTIQVRNNTFPNTGEGLEFNYNSTSGIGNILAYDRGGSVYKDLKLSGGTVKILDAGTDAITTDGSANVSIPNGDLTISGEIFRPDDDNRLAMAGGSTNSTGARLVLRGPSHATLPNDAEIWTGSTTTKRWIVDGSDGGLYSTNATGGSQGADTINANAFYENGVRVVGTSGVTDDALVYHSSNQSIATATVTTLSFDSEEYDDSSIHDTVTNNSRLTVPSGIARVRLVGQVGWAGGTTGRREAYIRKNGTTDVAHVIQPYTGVGSHQQITTPVLIVSPGDYFELRAAHTEGSNLSVQSGIANTWFAMESVG